MKKLIFIYILMNVSLLAFPQAIHIYHDGEKTPDVVANAGIDSIYFAPKFLGSTEYQQVFVTQDGEKRYDVVDSIKFNLPHLVATHHRTVYVPIDHGGFHVEVSCHGGEEPILVFPDGHTRLPFGLNHEWLRENNMWVWGCYMYGWDCNETNEYADVRTEIWYVVSGEMRDSIVVKTTGLPFANNKCENICFSNDEVEYTLDTNLPNSRLDFNVEGVDWYYNEDGKPVIHFSRNDSGEKRAVQLGLSVGSYNLSYEHWMHQLGKPFMHTSEEHMAALREFCDSTDFENWGKGLNWWNDEPLWKWNHVNGDINNYFWNIDDHVVELDLWSANFPDARIQGTIPASFEVFMDDVDGELNLRSNYLYGKIPYNIRHNKNWSKYGWNVIRQNQIILQQSPWIKCLDMEDINLRIDSVEVEDFVNGTISNTYDMLKKNKITWVINVGNVGFDIEGISDERVNKYLDYCEKGLGIIATVRPYWDTPYDDYRNYVLKQQELKGLPKSIIWTKKFGKADEIYTGCMSLLDSEGNLLWWRSRIYDYFNVLPFSLDSIYFAQIDSVLQKHLGEPTEHEIYVSEDYYESIDYSHDGEVLTLQKATIGKGVDLVFMGDRYVDTLLVEGGQYEQDMHAAMEYFFEVEPYKTLRDRFNVYAIKVVSPNASHPKLHEHSIVFEYASKVPNINIDRSPITVTESSNQISLSPECIWYDSGASISMLYGRARSLDVIHETGGHGFGKLLDEYIYAGYEKNHTEEGDNENFREWIKTAYHDKGWGMNISATDNPDEVPWSRFLKDERYQDEVGIYKGAWMWPEELWRPSETSIMNEASSGWFNAPSREAIYKRVMQFSEGDDWTYDYETFVEFDTPIREAHKQALAKARYAEGKVQEVQRRRIELRPPTIYKGSWRDAGKCEKVTFDKEKFVQPNTSKRNAVKSVVIDTGGGRQEGLLYIP